MIRTETGFRETIANLDEALEAANTRACLLKWALCGVSNFEGYPTADQVECFHKTAQEINVLLKFAIEQRQSERPAE